jgi:hypothetical protein
MHARNLNCCFATCSVKAASGRCSQSLALTDEQSYSHNKECITTAETQPSSLLPSREI